MKRKEMKRFREKRKHEMKELIKHEQITEASKIGVHFNKVNKT